jgi:dinuclear metal center YbgI/SA1388 family protein
MINLDYLQRKLDEYLYFDKTLNIQEIDPYMANGLLVNAKKEIKKVGFGVSASIALFQKANNLNCDVIIVHHAFNFPPYLRYDQIFQNRISYLLENRISLFGYHFLLDAHPKIGNNVQILNNIHAKIKQPYFHQEAPWGYLGEFEEEKTYDSIKKQLKSLLSPTSIYYQNKENIKRVVAVSGKGAPNPSEMQKLIDMGIDLYITGEAHEWNREIFKEAGINFIAGGHYNTEIFGIKALMDYVKSNFKGIDCSWLDLENDI